MIRPSLKKIPASVLNEIFLFALLYFGTARLSLLVAFSDTNASPIWPATGLSVAWMLHKGFRITGPGIFFGAFLANVATLVQHGTHAYPDIIVGSLLIALGNLAEAGLFARLAGDVLPKLVGGNIPTRVRFRLFIIAPVCCAVSAVVGAFTLVCLGLAPREFGWVILRTWWIGDLMGLMLVAPLAMSWIVSGMTGLSKLPWKLSVMLAVPTLACTGLLFHLDFMDGKGLTLIIALTAITLTLQTLLARLLPGRIVYLILLMQASLRFLCGVRFPRTSVPLHDNAGILGYCMVNKD